MLVVSCQLALAVCWAVGAEPGNAAYANDFEKAEGGKVPGEMMVLNGDFVVREEGGNQFLELPGSPLDAFGVLVGAEEGNNSAVSMRIYGTATGRRYPEFGVGVGGVSGHRLWLMPTVNELQIVHDNRALASVPFPWSSGTWTSFKFQCRKVGDKQWRLEGKAWAEGKAEPQKWMISLDVSEDPLQGRASLWGVPYSDAPIRFDDVVVGPAAPQ